ncbi:piggyBac transposable element-derived protein 4-like [Hydra vulgaris]|uniref:piggyBac transposable element-derived protein 4-like n=1 Tax=Hydra vulgaris TaxID=6087 RepID=UPI0032E9E7CD
MAASRKSYPKRSKYSVQDLVEYTGENDELSDLSSNSVSSNEGSIISVTEEEIMCTSADNDSETSLVDIDVMQLNQKNTNDEPNWIKIDGYKASSAKFEGNPGPDPSFLVNSSPLTIFEAFVTDDLVDLIVEQSNLFAVQYLKNNVIKGRSRVQKWTPLVRADIRLYIAFILYRGILWKPTNAMYFSTNPLFDTPLIRKVLSFDKFCLIEKFLHFVDNSSLPIHSCKKAKIEPIYDYLVNKFKTLYIPNKNISIDESLLLWKGHLSWKQYIPSKRSRFGMKSFALCESATGYIWNCFLYTGKEMTDGFALDMHKYKYQATKIVIMLMDNLIGNGYCLHVDNWYTSYEICKVLLDHNTDCIGTLRINRKQLPQDIKNAKIKTGDTLVRFDTKTNIMCTKWKDKKDVHMLSTCVQNDTVVVNRAGKEKNIPLVIHEYNKNMGGVDRSDQMLTTYESERKRVKKWYKKIFMHLISVSAFNANIINNKISPNMTSLQFRKSIIKESIVKYHESVEKKRSRTRVLPSPLRLVERHFVDAIPATEKNIKPCRRCVVCSENKVRSDTRYMCVDCNVGLCVVPCFKYYHTKENFKGFCK